MTTMGSVIMEAKKALRIRLCFEEQGMLRKWQIEQGLAKSWYLVKPHIVNIGHLAYQISVDFQLKYDVALEMCGFALPPLQPLSLLLDSDLVSVKHKQHPSSSAAQSRELITNSVSVDEVENHNGARFGAVELRALTEFERETGGYQSEHEEEEDEVFVGSRSMIEMQDTEALLKDKGSSGKKRNQPHTNMDIHGKRLELTNGNDGRTHQDKHKEKSSRKEKANRIDVRTHEKLADEFETLVEGGVVAVGAMIEKEKKKKKKEHGQEKIGPHDMDSIEDTQQKDAVAQVEEARSGKKRKLKMVHETMDLQQSVVKPIGERKASRKSKSARGSALDGGPEPGTDEVTPEEQGGCSHKKKKSKKIKSSISEEAEAGKEARKNEKSEEGRKGGEAKVHNHQQVPEEANVDESKKPSRSARRKKAKRRWLREQKQAGIQSGIFPEQEGAEKQLKRQLTSNESETSSEGEEVEAEEERLPVMIAPGHILFESADEDEQNQRRALLPILQLSDNVRCKRQGLAWGQEKTHHKQSARQKNHEKTYEKRPSQEDAEQRSFLDVKELPVASEAMFEQLPPLKGAPQVGDVLAYRLVELTASWTPELSTYRVGKVTSYEGKTKMVTLMPLALYPIYAQAEDLEMDAQQDEDLYLPPYNHDGTLEVTTETLMEVRVLEKGPDVMLGSTEEIPQAQNSIHASVTDPAPTRSAGLAVPLQMESLPKNAEASSETVSENLNVLIEEYEPQRNNGHPTSNVVDIVEKEEIVLTTKVLMVEESQSNSAWQDILSQELNKKKLELSGKFGKKLPGGEAPDLVITQAATTVSENMLSSNNEPPPSETGKVHFGKYGEPLIRHRHMRTGALGHTLALLRASQAL